MRRLVVGGLILAVLAWAFAHAKRPAGALSGSEMSRDGAPAPRDTTHEESLTVLLYFASPGGDSLVAESRALASRPGLHERVENLMKELARGSRHGGVPLLAPGTAVRHVYLDHRGLMTLDFTPAFRDRFRGGSTAEYLAIGSVVRTLLVNVPGALRVRLVCAGEPLATLGGHVACDQPFDGSDLR